ncbi:MAG: DUF853 family protein [Ornithinimicrobium sp.]|uniref:helicase HerA-like domain-containing protein n=1 Tax=Ornithinimicrobium sp. TaxID=1977084 RepID=UPI0026DF3894|nr:helicase HerA-like domain-containing protein [Ornithinimicrobium sp.]MDO5740842.1 DUF853 family protein [Ornithinimicrobium sp.]
MSEQSGDTQIDLIREGYAFTEPSIVLGAARADDGGAVVPEAVVRLPLASMNRHGLVAGATGTGKTVTLQVLAEQLSDAGVPVFLADIKGDLTGLATPASGGDKVDERMGALAQEWEGTAYPVELLNLGGRGAGTPVRATVTAFGPILLSKVLRLNKTQESSLGLVFHWADQQGLALLDLKDLRSVISHLVSDEGKDDLKDLGGLAKSTAGVLLREIVALSAAGGDVFFGETEFDTADLMRTTSEGKGIITCLELPGVQQQPVIFSTFLMWLLADLFQDLPEVGNPDKPKLVFFFDEAHLLFDDASSAFLNSVEQAVRLIRSKGVGVFFVTQTPTDMPDSVLAQLGNRVQHALRAHTPNDAKALKATVSTYPVSAYDLGEVLTSLGTGEAIVTVLSEKGAPTPVAWTMLRAPQGRIGPSDQDVVDRVVAASPLHTKYAEALDRESAYEVLAAKFTAAQEAAAASAATETTAAKEPAGGASRSRASEDKGVVEQVVGSTAFKSMLRSAGTVIGRELTRSIFGTGRRR